MVLYSQRYGSEESVSPLVIVHGLFGDGSNWRGIAVKISKRIPVITLDLPNHGNSEHSEDGTFQYIVDSIEETLDAFGVKQAHLMGHSMGGKAVLLLALKNPALCASLMLVDVAPKDYENKHGKILAGMEAVSKANVKSRSESDAILAPYEEDEVVRAFLLKNLVPIQRTGSAGGAGDLADASSAEDAGQYRWKFNRRVLTKYYDHIRSWVSDYKNPQYTGPTLFIRGELSDYILDSDLASIHQYCPNSRVELIQGSGHWVHAEKPAKFLNAIDSFLQEIDAVQKLGT